MEECRKVLSAKQMQRTLDRLAYEVIEAHGDQNNLVLIGIQRRGVDLASRIKKILDARLGKEIPMGSLDINLYRDDWTSLDVQPMINQTKIPFPIDEKDVLLVDDVLFTGRTIRAALEAILDFGRPRRVKLLVLVDRGHRELPIHADFVGKHVETARGEHVNAYFVERDGQDKVCVVA